MKTKSTLEKAVKFVSNCKFIFFSKKNIFTKNIFCALSFLTITLFHAENVDSHLSNLDNSNQASKMIYLNDSHLLLN